MKKVFTLLVCWIIVIAANAQIIDSIKPSTSLKSSILVKGDSDVFYLAKNLGSFGSLFNKKLRINLDEKLSRYIYNAIFKDSMVYDKYRSILVKEGLFKPLVKINKYFIDDKIFLFCSGVNLKSIINRLGQPDNLIYPFYFVLTLNKDFFSIESIKSIGNLPNDQYYLLENGDFFETHDTLYFTVARDEIIGKNSKIIGAWVVQGSDSLVFNSFTNMNIPNYFKRNSLNYNLIGYLNDGNYILFNNFNSVFNAINGEEIVLQIQTPDNIYRDIMNADIEINAVNLSFEINGDFINVLRRQKESLYYSTFKLLDGSLLVNIKLPDSISKCTMINDNTCFISKGVLFYVDEQQKNLVRYKIEF